ncbi:MAG: hypothetical protein AB1627_07185, partial [Chloroflexota bacterium]
RGARAAAGDGRPAAPPGDDGQDDDDGDRADRERDAKRVRGPQDGAAEIPDERDGWLRAVVARACPRRVTRR